MKKLLFGIFAHPDDEAFGPSATLYKAAQAGTDVHLIVVTDGDSGANVDGHKDLAKKWHAHRCSIYESTWLLRRKAM